jgi:hypothetical protein
MCYEIRRQQHRVYWRKATSGRDYEAFPTKDQAQAFIAVCKNFGRDKVVDRHLARAIGQAPTVVSAPATRCPHTITVPALAAGLTAPAPAGVTLAWLGEQYVSSGTGETTTRAATTAVIWQATSTRSSGRSPPGTLMSP